MSNFDLEAGKRFRKERNLLEALRCMKSAVEADRDDMEAYVELARTYILAFDESGDPLCLDSARKVCIAGLRRDPGELEKRLLFEMQDQVEEMLLESQKAEVDAMSDALNDSSASGDSLLPTDASTDGLLEEIEDRFGDKPDFERGH